MKFLKTYKLFENLQQAENYVVKNNLDQTYYTELKEYTKEKGKLGLLYLLTIILFNSQDQRVELEKLKHYLDKIIFSNIKIDANQTKPDLFYQYVDNEMRRIEANKFVDQFAPGFLKKEIKRNYLDQIVNLDFESIEKEALRGKMSIFEKPEDWIKYVTRLSSGKDDLDNVRNSEDVDVLYEDKDWVFYYPKTYDAINYINYPQWCTIYEEKYSDYINKGYYFIILHNKWDKHLSYIIQVYPEKDDLADPTAPENTKDYFSIHAYDGKGRWYSWDPQTFYYGWKKENLNSGGLKIFFEKFVRNNKIDL